MIKKRIRKFVEFVTRASLDYMRDSAIEEGLQRCQTSSGIELYCRQENRDFLLSVIVKAEKVLAAEGMVLVQHIDTLIESSPQYKTSFMAGAICPENVNLWVGCDSLDFDKYTAYFVYYALLSNEFKKGMFIFSRFNKRFVKDLRKKADRMVQRHNG